MKTNRKGIINLTIAFSLSVVAMPIIASDFNIPFITAAGLGTMYAGWAAGAEDASTAYSNPAGLVKISHKQLVFSGLGLTGHTQFQGATTPPFPPFPAQKGKAPSQLKGFIPTFYFATPISDNMVLGFSENVPFALGTRYGVDSIVRYAATKTQIGVMDLGTSLGIKLSQKLSLGIGLDIDYLALTLNSRIGSSQTPDLDSHNFLTSWGTGWHGGLLYDLTPATRVGLSYNSRVSFRAYGTSSLVNPTFSTLKTTTLSTSATMPDLTQLSLYHALNSQWTVMGTVFYTNWSVLKQVVLKNIIIPTGGTTTATLPFNYRNTFDYAAGLTYQASEKWLLRSGVEFLGVPSNNIDRLVGDPISRATIVGVGAHYQQTPHIGYDVGYAHGFFNNTSFNHVTPFNTQLGYSSSFTNIVALQITWNMA